MSHRAFPWANDGRMRRQSLGASAAPPARRDGEDVPAVGNANLGTTSHGELAPCSGSTQSSDHSIDARAALPWCVATTQGGRRHAPNVGWKLSHTFGEGGVCHGFDAGAAVSHPPRFPGSEVRTPRIGLRGSQRGTRRLVYPTRREKYRWRPEPAQVVEHEMPPPFCVMGRVEGAV